MKFLSECLPSFLWLKKEFSWKSEMLAAFVGVLLVIPQGLAFAELTGVAPIYGIYTSIWVTFLASFLGNSTMMSGPNTAISILIGLSLDPFAGRFSNEFTEYVFIISFLTGCFQFLIWLTRSSHLFNYLLKPTTSGISMGVGILIILSALKKVIGWQPESQSLSWPIDYLFISSVTVFSGFYFLKKTRYYIPLALIIGSVAGFLLSNFYAVSFLPSLAIEGVGFRVPEKLTLIHELPPQIFLSAFFIAVLGLSQSLVISRQLNLTTSEHINLSKESSALAIANIFSSFFSSFAGSGSFNRTQANQEMGAKTPLPGILTGVGVFFLITLSGGLLKHLPLAVISGILLIVGARMIKLDQIKEFHKKTLDAFSFWSVFLTFVFIGLTQAISLALLISLIVYLKNKRLKT